MGKLLSAADWSLIGGLVAKEFQNAKRAQLRATTPIANEMAGVRVEMIGKLLRSLSSEQVHENQLDTSCRSVCDGVSCGGIRESNARVGENP